MLSREQMVETINKGGSVKLPNGRLATRLEQLPSAAALAKTPEEKAKAAGDLDAQIEKLQAQKSELGKAEETSKEPAKSEEKGKPEDKSKTGK